MFTIKGGRLYNDETDISDELTGAQLEKESKTLLSYSKFKIGVEKLAAQCFGPAPKRKRKPTAKPAEKPEPASTKETVKEVSDETAIVGSPVEDSYILSNGNVVNTDTGEIF